MHKASRCFFCFKVPKLGSSACPCLTILVLVCVLFGLKFSQEKTSAQNIQPSDLPYLSAISKAMLSFDQQATVTCYNKKCYNTALYCDLESSHCRVDSSGGVTCEVGGTERGIACWGYCVYDEEGAARCERNETEKSVVWVVVVVVVVMALIVCYLGCKVRGRWKSRMAVSSRRRRESESFGTNGTNGMSVQQNITFAGDNRIPSVSPSAPSYNPPLEAAPPPYPTYPSRPPKPAGWNPNPAKIKCVVPSAPRQHKPGKAPYLGVG